MRVVSKAALKKLAKILRSQGVTCEKLSDVLGSRNSSTHRGDTEDALFEIANDHALRGRFNRATFDKIQVDLDTGRPDDFEELAVAMEFRPPRTSLLSEGDLKQLKELSEKARLQDPKRFMPLRDKLDVHFRDFAARADDDEREQLRAWFDACSRQVIEAGDRPWIVELTHCASEGCDDAEIRQAFERVRDVCKTAVSPWDLSGVLRRSAAPRPVDQTLRRGARPAPDAGEPADLPNGPPKAGYALVVGIGEYAAAGLTPLKCAAKDARQVAAYLQGHRDIDFSAERVRMLTDRDATLRGILGGLDRLRSDCARSPEPDPLAVVYFSGHGMPDLAGRHFLVPHDGDPLQLFATALWNQTFNAALEQIRTRRLLVLLDACHAQGMVLQAGVKDGAAYTYNPAHDSEGLRLEPGRGRYFIASCAAGQRSFEGEENGLFTQALLDVMNFEGVEAEQLDLAELYRELRLRVNDAARRQYDGHSQTPTANIADDVASTGLILAINQRRAESREDFLAAVRKHLQEARIGQWGTMVARLENFVYRNERPMSVDPIFFQLFDEYATVWQGADDAASVKEACELLATRLGAPKAARGAALRGTSDFAPAPAPSSPASSAAPGPSAPLSVSSGTQVPAPATAPRSPGAAIPMYELRVSPTDG